MGRVGGMCGNGCHGAIYLTRNLGKEIRSPLFPEQNQMRYHEYPEQPYSSKEELPGGVRGLQGNS